MDWVYWLVYRIGCKETFVDWNDPSYPDYVLLIFAENVLVRNYNDAVIQKLYSPIVSTDTIYRLPKGVTLFDKELISLKTWNPTDPGNLSF